MDKKNKEEILERYLSGETDPQLTEIMQGWIEGKLEEPALDALLEEYFADKVTYREPNADTYRRFRQIQRMLGLPVSTVKRPLVKRAAFRVAAVLIPLFMLAGASWLYINSQPGAATEDAVAAMVTKVSPAGEQRYVVLDDNSVVLMNGGSKIVYAEDFSSSREVYLEGEAYFEVKKGMDVPFKVRAGHATIVVTGTQFNVTAVPGEAETVVSLIEGSVNVTAGNRTVALSPMERFTFDNIGKLAEVSSISVENGWWNAPIMFEDKTLHQMLDIIEKHYDMPIIGKESITDSVRYTIKFDMNEPVEHILDVLRRNIIRFEYSRAGDSIVIE